MKIRDKYNVFVRRTIRYIQNIYGTYKAKYIFGGCKKRRQINPRFNDEYYNLIMNRLYWNGVRIKKDRQNILMKKKQKIYKDIEHILKKNNIDIDSILNNR